ncbi:hypothetical protein [Parapedobacter pyrenivorans]|uniref:baeRF3 domain-containing protein n=1 Tax=Parapedobacter pyrenivorans TaxID=1305674 RepID=UPI00333F9D4F
MVAITAKQLDRIGGDHKPPVFSVYMPTHRKHPDNAQDPAIFKKLVQEFEPVRSEYVGDEAIQAIFAKFEKLADDFQFWQHTREGLAVFATRESFDVYRLTRSVKPLAVVADSAHTKPLLQYLQTSDRYHLLVLSTNTAQLYEGDRYQLDEVDLSEVDVPESMIDALDHELRDLHATLAAYRTATNEDWNTRQNHGLKKTDIDNDIEQFFRAVDRAVTVNYSIPSQLPLILAALPEHHHLFRRVSRNKQLITDGIKTNATVLPKDELRKLAWEIIEPHHTARLNDIIQQFRQAATHGVGADQIEAIVKDAYDGKVGVLLLEADRFVAGRIVGRDHVVFHTEKADHLVDDVLDDLAELVLRQGGEVWIIPRDRMPASTGVASINRY